MIRNYSKYDVQLRGIHKKTRLIGRVNEINHSFVQLDNLNIEGGVKDCGQCKQGDATCYSPFYRINDVIIMQSIGVQDKNGKDIFELDVVKWLGFEVKDGKQIRPEKIRVVYWDFVELFHLNNLITSGFNEVEIVGNLLDKGHKELYEKMKIKLRLAPECDRIGGCMKITFNDPNHYCKCDDNN